MSVISLASPSVRVVIVTRSAKSPECASLTRAYDTLLVPYPLELKHLGRFALANDTVSSDALRTVLTPGSPGGGGGVGVTGGFTLPVTTCWTVLTLVRIVGPERGCSQARNWSRTLARIDRGSHASQT